jgi:hypothetical protein
MGLRAWLEWIPGYDYVAGASDEAQVSPQQDGGENSPRPSRRSSTADVGEAQPEALLKGQPVFPNRGEGRGGAASNMSMLGTVLYATYGAVYGGMVATADQVYDWLPSASVLTCSCSAPRKAAPKASEEKVAWGWSSWRSPPEEGTSTNSDTSSSQGASLHEDDELGGSASAGAGAGAESAREQSARLRTPRGVERAHAVAATRLRACAPSRL